MVFKLSCVNMSKNIDHIFVLNSCTRYSVSVYFYRKGKQTHIFKIQPIDLRFIFIINENRSNKRIEYCIVKRILVNMFRFSSFEFYLNFFISVSGIHANDIFANNDVSQRYNVSI